MPIVHFTCFNLGNDSHYVSVCKYLGNCYVTGCIFPGFNRLNGSLSLIWPLIWPFMWPLIWNSLTEGNPIAQRKLENRNLRPKSMGLPFPGFNRLNGNVPLILPLGPYLTFSGWVKPKIVILGKKYFGVPRGTVENRMVSPLQLRTDIRSLMNKKLLLVF